MSSKKTHFITPPASTRPSTEEFNEKTLVVNTYILNASVYITSLWLDPLTEAKSLFGCSTPRPDAYECFLREVLKRSRCSMPALQVALFYMSKLTGDIKQRLVKNNAHLMCPKKVFLICLILSFKYNYDQNYSFKSWSKISGLTVQEMKSLEVHILQDFDYSLNLNNEEYTRWVIRSNEFTMIHSSRSVKRTRDEPMTAFKKIRVN
jgi:hypothetical protein